jgi:hypothetical protein
VRYNSNLRVNVKLGKAKKSKKVGVFLAGIIFLCHMRLLAS